MTPLSLTCWWCHTSWRFLQGRECNTPFHWLWNELVLYQCCGNQGSIMMCVDIVFYRDYHIIVYTLPRPSILWTDWESTKSLYLEVCINGCVYNRRLERSYSAIAFILRKCVILSRVRAKCKPPHCFQPVSWPASDNSWARVLLFHRIFISGCMSFTPPRNPEPLHEEAPPILKS